MEERVRSGKSYCPALECAGYSRYVWFRQMLPVPRAFSIFVHHSGVDRFDGMLKASIM